MSIKERNVLIKKLKQAIKNKDEFATLILAKRLTNAGYNLANLK